MSDVQDVGEVSSTTDISQVPSGEIVESVTHTLQNEAIAEAVNSITGQPDAAGRATGLEEVTLQDGSAILAQPDQEATSSQRDHVILTTQEQGHEGTIPVADNTTLQSLLAANSAGTAQLATANGETIQIITVSNPSDLAALTTAGGGKLWQVLPAMTNQEIATIIAVNQPEVSTTSGADGQDADGDQDGQEVQSSDVVLPMNALPDTVTGILLPQPAQNLPPGCPSWATRLKDCERIGDSYRGWVESEVELDLLLTYHKQQTQSFWGTRQSPSPAKASTRLMWKSQYVPFDGMPFVNAGSRAIVMECQFGPRRKGAQIKRQGDHLVKGPYKQTCPARIYIKKVRKFPEFAVDTSLDKKTLKIAMDKSFQELKMRGIKEGWGQERYYVQLPSEEAHEFHVGNPEPTPAPASQQPETITITADIRDSSLPHRLHSQVANKIRELVAGGETRLYAIRKALRRFVMREMFDSVDKIPERHNLTYFPTVNDLQNHIHQAIRDIEKGVLPVTAPTVNVEVITSGDSQTSDSNDMHGVDQALWDQERPGEGPHAETVTVTLTQNPGEDGHHTISRVETHLSDGTTQVSDTLSPETAQLLSKLHPNMFPAGTLLQVQDPAQPNNQNQAIAMETTLTHSDQEDHSGLVIQDQSNLVIKQPDEMVVQLTDQTQTVLDQGQGQILLQQQGQGHIIVQQDPNQLLVQQDHALVMEGQVSEDMMDNNDGQAHALTSLQIVQADDVGQSVVQPHMITVAMAPETGEAVQLVKDNGLGP